MTPEALLYTDAHGNVVGLDEVAWAGADGQLLDRRPALRELVRSGSPRDRLEAAAVLSAWGDRHGLLVTIEWANDPEGTPWAGEPVTFDRIWDVDDAFALLAKALMWGQDAPLTDAGAALRVAATKAILLSHDRVFVARDLATLLDVDDALRRAVRYELTWAVEKAVDAAALPRQRFDVATQAAFLVGPLAREDDAAAAQAARRLLDLMGVSNRASRELALALSAGMGGATLAVLEELYASPAADVRAEAEERLAERRSHAPPVAGLDLVLLRTWAERLCRLPDAVAGDVAHALGVGPLVQDDFGRWRGDEPVPGCTELELGLREGRVFTVTLRLAEPQPRRHEIETHLRVGRDVPRVHRDSPQQVAHDVAVPGAPFFVTAVWAYQGEARRGSHASEVLLRREPVLAQGEVVTAGIAWDRAGSWHLAVADRPVLVARSADDALEVHVLDLRSGALIRDDTWPSRATSRGEPVEPISPKEFDRLVHELQREASHARQVVTLRWRATGNADLPYVVEHEGTTYHIELGEFPAMAVYRIHVDGQVVDRLDEWPALWLRDDAGAP